jgi:hypothetical protein
LDKYDEQLAKSASKTTPATSPSPAASPAAVEPTGTPVAAASPAPAASPGKDVNILPPPTPVQAPPAVPAAPGNVQAPPSPPSKLPTAAPAPEVEELPYTLAGSIKTGNQYTAMLQKDGKGYDVKVGTKLAEGWVVTAVTENSVTLRKGRDTKILKMKTTGIKPAPPATVKDGSYPKATQATPKTVQPGGAPPAPASKPAKVSKPAPKADEPTVIPID